jgi:hypothetical protein
LTTSSITDDFLKIDKKKEENKKENGAQMGKGTTTMGKDRAQKMEARACQRCRVSEGETA